MCVLAYLVGRLALSGNLDFLGEIGTLALELIQSLVGLLAQQFLGLVIVAVQAVEANGAGLLASGLAARLALKLGLGGEADLVSRNFATDQFTVGVFLRFVAVSRGLARFRSVNNLVTVGRARSRLAARLLLLLAFVLFFALFVLFLLAVVVARSKETFRRILFVVRFTGIVRFKLRVGGERFILGLALLTVVVLAVLALTIGNNVRFSEFLGFSKVASLGGDKFVLGFTIKRSTETAHLSGIEVRSLDANILTVVFDFNAMSGGLDVNKVTIQGNVAESLRGTRGLLARVNNKGFLLLKGMLFTIDRNFVLVHLSVLGSQLNSVLQKLNFNKDTIGGTRLGRLGSRNENSEETIGRAVTSSQISALTHFVLEGNIVEGINIFTSRDITGSGLLATSNSISNLLSN